MKKLYLVFMAVLLITLVACSSTTTTMTTTAAQTTSTTAQTTTDTTEQLTTTEAATTTAEVTTAAYDPRGLVPDSCSFLDNIGDWQPVWCDEFNTDGLPDSSRWLYQVGGSGWGNNELQYYTSEDLDNAYVSDGTLKITALKESFMGSDYTSARLISKYQGDWQYGRIQVRAKLPSGVGTWPAVWMMPTDNAYGGWPNSGEIDIMEHVGYDPNHVFGTVHTAARNGKIGNQIGFSKDLPTAESEFHVYELIWEPGYMQVLVDGESFGIFGYNPTINIDISNSDAWPFDKRFYLIMNLAVGGDWGGAQGVDDSIFPQTLEVDYVRVYQKDYAGMDQAAPEKVTGITSLDKSYDSIKITWNKPNDDVMVKEYDVFVDDVLVGTTSVNAWRVDDLDPLTSYTVNVIAKDFAGHRSDPSYLTITTDSVRSVSDGIIEAESYDSQSGVIRDNSDVASGGQYVGWIDTDDYMEYILYVPETADYTATFRVASESAAGQIKLYGKLIIPYTTIDLPVTGDWQTWTSVTTNSFSLPSGVYTFKVRASIGGFNLDYFEFKKVEQ